MSEGKKPKINKYIKRALEYLELSYTGDSDLSTMEGLDAVIKEQERIVSDAEATIAEWEEHLAEAIKTTEIFKDVKAQAECEMIREMNPKAIDVFNINRI